MTLLVNRISASLPPADQDKILKGIHALQKLLPFSQSLASEERVGLLRLGDRGRAFVQKAQLACQAHPEALPRNFDEAEFAKDAALVETLYPVLMAMRQLANLVEDTYALAASEAYAGALVVYRSLRDNDQDGGFEPTLDDLALRFARKSSKKSAPTEAAPASTTTQPML